MKQFTWILLMVIFTGCSSSSYITTSWKAADASPKNYKKILVLGLIGEPDRSIREKMEQHIVGDLKELGYNAVCSCEEYNPKAFENMKEQEALAKLESSGIEAVLTIVLLDKQKEKYYVPGRINYTPYNYYHNRFWGYYNTMYDRINTKGYYNTDTKYFWESNFYDLQTKQLLYSAQSQSFDTQSSETLGHEYGKMIVKDMVKKNVLQKQVDAPLKSF